MNRRFSFLYYLNDKLLHCFVLISTVHTYIISVITRISEPNCDGIHCQSFLANFTSDANGLMALYKIQNLCSSTFTMERGRSPVRDHAKYGTSREC